MCYLLARKEQLDESIPAYTIHYSNFSLGTKDVFGDNWVKERRIIFFSRLFGICGQYSRVDSLNYCLARIRKENNYAIIYLFKMR